MNRHIFSFAIVRTLSALCVCAVLAACYAIVREPLAQTSMVQATTIKAQSPMFVTGADVGPSNPLNALRAQINLVRQENGLPALGISRPLNNLAQSYAIKVASAGRIAHTGIDGTTLTQRVNATGHPFRYFNENLSAGYPSAQMVVDAWMRSPGHRRNLLSNEISVLGVGYALNPLPNDDWTHYWVMVAGDPF